MREALTAFVPLFAFMLLPVWIPLLTVTVGWVADRVGGRKHDAFAARLADVKARSHARRAELAAARHELQAGTHAARPALVAEAA
ncbi:hypothetical protein D0Z08_30400 [Nocardioides immobilis]|uniref:Uncharacterized protein n=1 Tax=Nocardioides immobilis TaxID=2049295 RepID=A0A417XSW0_9ACTN|nr:hypothetical protein [Nocardioides immobilis]RHW23331.1 hypothetical protein D0Z08_30400 [Nocardioides immobilis]